MFNDIKVINQNNFKDKRGLLWTTWKKGLFKNIKFNHDKFSLSKKNTLRAFHCDFKSKNDQQKLRLRGLDQSGEIRSGILRGLVLVVCKTAGWRPDW